LINLQILPELLVQQYSKLEALVEISTGFHLFFYNPLLYNDNDIDTEKDDIMQVRAVSE